MLDNHFFKKSKNRQILGGVSIFTILMICSIVWMLRIGKQENLVETEKTVENCKFSTETAGKEPKEDGKNGGEGKVLVSEIKTEQVSIETTYSRVKTMAGNIEKANSEYKLVWQDNFNGNSLNMKDWNYEYHEPGWVNAELQEYVDSKDNIYVKDGKLVIQAIKTVDKDGKASYTSGRINTQNKHDYKYGRFEMRAKVPSGKGFLPAFWMMPTNENVYGQWPKCGEIDIMEVLGDKLTTSHGTLHFGEPHTQKQGTYTLTKGDFYSQYHVFACEWDPDEFRFYVDGTLFYTANDWFTKKNGYGEVAYPAPYDQPFYMILNVAVGGSWVGYPEDDAVFGDNARMVVDYVKVYQKDDYDENVKKPVKEVKLRNADKTGNYVINADFSEKESLTDGKGWDLLLAGKGQATANISNKALHINSKVAGEYDYSVQIVQANQPLEKGYRYKLSFDAYADVDRTMVTGITAPDLSYSRYMQDTKVNLTTKKQSFIYEFDMTSDSDANGRIEFNLGNQGSIAAVHISNVHLEKVKAIKLPENTKSVLPDGNYVYNGEFQEGTDRLAYWTIKKDIKGATISVTNNDLVRELKAVIPKSVTKINQVKVVQENIAITGGKEYTLRFDAYADKAKKIQVVLAGKTFNVSLTKKKNNYKFTFKTAKNLMKSNLEFLLGVAGITYIDNVRVQENAMITNGDFSNGTVGFEVWNDTSVSDISYGVDGLKENNAFTMTINKTGNEAWQIQLKQNDITLEKGKWYKVSFDAKSTIDRKIMYAFQKNGLKHKTESGGEDWTPYYEDKNVSLTSKFQTITKVFQMKEDTDPETILSISMGAIDGDVINKKHIVTIDNITLEETQEPAASLIDTGVNQLKAFDNADGNPWQILLMQSENAYSLQDGTITFAIKNVGSEDWHVQMKQMGLILEKGCKYQLKFHAKSTKERAIRTALMNSSYNWYAGCDKVLKAGQDTEVVVEFTMDKNTDSDVGVFISMGNLGADISVPSDITLWDFSLIKVE